MAINVLNRSSWPPLRFLSLALRGWSRRQGPPTFCTACLFSLCLASLKCSPSSAASLIAEGLQVSEDTDSATEGRQGYGVLGSNEDFPSVSLFTSRQPFTLLDDADAVDVSHFSDANPAFIILAAQIQNSAPAVAAEPERVSLKLRMQKADLLRISAATSLLFVFLAVSVVALVRRRRQAATAAAEEPRPQLKEPVDIFLTDAEAAAAADAKVAYLVKLEAGANELVRMLRAENAIHILHNITRAVEACKIEAEALHQKVHQKGQQQQEQEDIQQQGDQLWVASWDRLTHLHSAAVDEVDRLLDTASPFLRAQAGAANFAHIDLLKMNARIERLCEEASAALKVKIGETLLQVSQSAVSESLKGLHVVNKALARFTHSLALRRSEYPEAAAEAKGAAAAKTRPEARGLGLVLEQAVAAAQMLALNLAEENVQMKWTCSELDTILVPDALADAVNAFKSTAQEVDAYAKEVQQVLQQLLETTDVIEALFCTRRVELACERTVKRLREAPSVSVVLPSSLHAEEAPAAAESAATGFRALTVDGKSTLVQQAVQREEQRQERLLKLRSELELETGSSGGHILGDQGLVAAVLEEIKSMLREQPKSFTQIGFSSADFYDSWEQAMADLDKVSSQLKQAIQRLASVRGTQQLQLEAKEILHLKLELVDLASDVVYLAADFRAWAMAERALSAALQGRAKAAKTLADLQLQQQQQEQKATPLNVRAVNSLVAAVDETFKRGNVAAVLDLASKITEETGTIEDYVQSTRLSLGGSA
ncbi:hypothetical protein Esti_006392 [Eimeria stiedai]